MFHNFQRAYPEVNFIKNKQSFYKNKGAIRNFGCAERKRPQGIVRKWPEPKT